jgi:hypothetical protein
MQVYPFSEKEIPSYALRSKEKNENATIPAAPNRLPAVLLNKIDGNDCYHIGNQ